MCHGSRDMAIFGEWASYKMQNLTKMPKTVDTVAQTQ